MRFLLLLIVWVASLTSIAVELERQHYVAIVVILLICFILQQSDLSSVLNRYDDMKECCKEHSRAIQIKDEHDKDLRIRMEHLTRKYEELFEKNNDLTLINEELKRQVDHA